MHNEDSTAASVRTDWTSIGVDQMWAMLADQVDGPAWDQSAAWQRAFELLDYHHARVQEYRDLLAERWPPERSPAAQTFLGQVDGMLSSLRVMRDAALANGPALAHLTASLAEARTELEPVHQQWATNEAKLAGYRQSAVPGNGLPVPAPGPPPVSASQQSQLHAQAASIMSTLGMHALEAQNALRTPALYKPPQPGIGDFWTDDPGLATSALRGNGGSGADGLSSQSSSPPPRKAAAGAVLSGTPSSVAPVSAGPPSLASPTSLGQSTSSSATGYGFPGLGPVERFSAVRSIDESQGQRNGNRLYPRAGVVGPSSDITEEEPRTAGTRRVNPIGGVIGPQSGHENGMVSGPMAGSHGGDGRRRRRNPAYDSADQWPVRTGVSPVLKPGDEPIHNPGPVLGQRS